MSEVADTDEVSATEPLKADSPQRSRPNVPSASICRSEAQRHVRPAAPPGEGDVCPRAVPSGPGLFVCPSGPPKVWPLPTPPSSTLASTAHPSPSQEISVTPSCPVCVGLKSVPHISCLPEACECGPGGDEDL